MIVSVIMPLFNAEKYLPEALNSILRQTCEDFEVICINDDSADDTGKILEKFRESDDRIKILTNEKRLGAGLSRNKGIEAAKGKYVLFLDGDDVFDEQLLEKASAAMEKYKAELVLFETLYHVPSGEIYRKSHIQRSKEFKHKYCEKPFSFYDFTPEEFPNCSDSPCDKMLSRNLIMDNRLEFQDLPSSNDVYFVKMAMFCARRIIWLNDSSVLVYAREHAEASRISLNRNPMCAYLALKKLVLELKNRNMPEELSEYIYYTVQSKLFYLFSVEQDEERKKSFYRFLHDEGIGELIACGGEYYAKADRYVRCLLEGFRDYPYERGWFLAPDSYFQYCLNNSGDAVRRFIQDKKSKDKRIILWGAGVNGKTLLGFLEKHSMRITGVVDCDESKQGTSLYGYEITNPVCFNQKADYMLFTSGRIYQEAVRAIEDKNVTLVNVWDLL